MRVRTIGLVTALASIALFAATTCAADNVGQGGKGGRKKQLRGEKVELESLPPTVVEAAKKETPNVTFVSAEKHQTKRQGTTYSLQGSDGKHHVSLTVSAAGKLLRLTKVVEGRGRKNGT